MKKALLLTIPFIFSTFSCGCSFKTTERSSQGLIDVKEKNETSPPIASNGDTVVPQKERSLRLMYFALILLNSRYVDPSRINWRTMTVYGIDALQNMVPEMVAKFDRRIDDFPMKVDIRVGLSTKSYSLAEIRTLDQAYRISQDIYNYAYSHLSDPKDPDEMEYSMINGMFSTLDPHTNLLPPYLFDEVMTGNGGFGGCGFVVGVRDDNLTVISPMEGAPAWRVGIRTGDIIVRIDDESTENMPLQDAVDRMRGDVGSKVTLYVKRKGWTEAKPFVITREQIEIKSVTSHALIKDNVGYLKLKSFDQTTAEEVRKHLSELHKAMPKMHGLVLDLRNNSGGLLVQSIEIAELFLRQGQTVVSVEGPTRADRESTSVRVDGTEQGYPIVILINEGSASASEIVSGALQHHGRAVVVGERSFGKGSVQVLKDNPDGSAIKITAAQYLTPGDISIQGVGIVPDIRLTPAFIDEESGVSLVETQNIRREDTLEQSLHSDKTTKRESSASLRYLYQPPKEEEERAKALGLTTYDLRSTEDYAEDSEIDFAVALIKQAKSSDRQEIIDQSGDFIKAYGSGYRKEVRHAFAKQKIDWTPENEDNCNNFEWGLVYGDQTASDGQAIQFPADGNENQLKMWIKNTCTSGDLVQMLASLKSNDSAFDEREFVFGRIPPGETREWPIKVKLPKSMPTRDDLVEIQFYSGETEQGQLREMDRKGSFVASTVRPATPLFAYTYWIDDIRRGNGDGLLSRGESVDMYLWIKNVSQVDSEKVNINIANESGSGVLLQQGRATIEKLAAGESRLVVLKFDVSKDRPQKPPSKRIKRDRPFNPDEVVLQLMIADNAYDERIVQPVIFPVSQQVFESSTAKTGVDKGLAAGKSIKVAAVEGINLGTTKNDMNVEAIDLGNGVSGICWKEGELNPCAFTDTSSLSAPHSQPLEKTENPSSSLDVSFAYEPPRIVFDEQPHSQKGTSSLITAMITDNDALRDYEAYLWTHDGLKLKIEKLDYGLVTGREKKVAIEMPLRPGDNTLVIMTRDRLDTETIGSFHINGEK